MIIHRPARQGTILPLLAFCLIALLICMALAIDIGMMAILRVQLQMAADNAALAGARALTGDQSTNNNYSGAITAAQTAAQANLVMSQPLVQNTSDIHMGVYYYDTTYAYTDNNNNQQTGHFFDSTNTTTSNGVTVPADRNGNAFATPQNWNLAKVVTRANQPTFFSNLFGYSPGQTTATASACHRPRDVAIILDYSVSMSYGSQGVWNYSGNSGRGNGPGPSASNGVSSLNPDTNFPQFGHWSAYNPNASVSGMHRTTNFVRSDTGEVYPPNNWAVASNYTGPAVINDFYTLGSSGGTSIGVTGSTTDTSFTQSPGGTAFTYLPTSGPVSDYVNQTGAYNYDKWAFCKNNPSKWAATVQDIVGSTSKNANWESLGYASIPGHAALTPYTVGPGYYGITFFIWPPDPTKDWRTTYFTNVTTGGKADNTKLFTSGGIWLGSTAQGGPTPNYNAILSWIANSPVYVFPPNLYSGHICYYKSIPTTTTVNAGDSTDLQLDKAFWKAYIDYMFVNDCTQRYGTQENDLANSSQSNFTAYFGCNYSGNNSSPGVTTPPANGAYMSYTDNPVRPKLGFWFGGLSMLYFILDNQNWWPGTAHQAHSWHLKAGMNAVMNDIKTNHPNDQFAVINFSSGNTWTQSVVAMGQNYEAAKDVLFFPNQLVMANNSTISSSWGVTSYERPYTATVSNGTPSPNSTYSSPTDVPAPNGSTCPQSGFGIAFNELSSASGFSGRKGAAKLVIFETDGYPTQYTTAATYSSNSTSTAWRQTITNIGSGTTGDTSGSLTQNPGAMYNSLSIVQRITAQDTASPPGYSTARTLTRVHGVAFGDDFDTNVNNQTNSHLVTSAKAFLLQVQIDGYTSNPTDTDIQSWKYIVGTANQRIAALGTCFTNIMQSGVKVVLVR